MQEIKADITDRVMTHDKPVVASRLNRANNQVYITCIIVSSIFLFQSKLGFHIISRWNFNNLVD